mmetsp:Transcript_44342/g.141136  ORF Transcript_44342/g.141136 Transcript_44342/m.141136 type:complete len:456 (+) Transcript_44342:48-1415(+)
MSAIMASPAVRPVAAARSASRKVQMSAVRSGAAMPKGLGVSPKPFVGSQRMAQLDSAARRPLKPVNVAVPMNLNLEDPSAREAMAKEYGFDQIGAPVPKELTLLDIINSMPKEIFELNEWKAIGRCIISVVSMAASIALIHYVPTWLLPAAWFVAGTAFTGFFVIGHDCAHRSFSNNNLWEDIVGHIFFAPLAYPYEPWRIKHNKHHAVTNMLVEDTAWHPVMKEDFDTWPAPVKFIMKHILGSPLKCFASIGHWMMFHFDLRLFKKAQYPRVLISLAVTFAWLGGVVPALVHYLGAWGMVKYWLMPWVFFHFWMSTFTVIHHTAPHIPFRGKADWDSAEAQLGGTVHCEFPAWVEWLCHDISVHIPHHVSQRIPSYNLRAAHNFLVDKYGQYMNICHWNFKLMKYIFTELHIYDEEKNYVPFDSDMQAEKQKQDIFLSIERKVLPGGPIAEYNA